MIIDNFTGLLVFVLFMSLSKALCTHDTLENEKTAYKDIGIAFL